jgi:hypothetical protein
VRQRVVFHPALRPTVKRVSHKTIQLLQHCKKGSATLAKAEGMFRFALEGKRPLADKKAALLASL